MRYYDEDIYDEELQNQGEREIGGGGGSLVLTVHANGFLWSFTTISMETAKLATSHTHIMQTPQSVQNQRIFESKVPGEISSVLRDRRSSMHTNHTPDDPPPSPPSLPPFPTLANNNSKNCHTSTPPSLLPYANLVPQPGYR